MTKTHAEIVREIIEHHVPDNLTDRHISLTSLDTLIAERDALIERLEITHVYVNGKKVPAPKGIPDGISCRDATIKLLEARIAELEERALPFPPTKGHIGTAEIIESGEYECPCCDGEGVVTGRQFINFDNLPLNVLFSGIGDEYKAWESWFGAAIAKINEVKG